MPPVQPFAHNTPLAPWLALLALAGPLAAQTALPVPPAFSQQSIVRTAEEVALAWTTWKTGDKDMEQKIFRVPMAEARGALQRSLGRYLDFLDIYRSYNDQIAGYIDRSRLQPRPGQPVVAMEDVYSDEIEALGVNAAALQERLDALRSAAEWVAIRRAVQTDRTQLLTLQTSLRTEMPLELTINRPTDVQRPAASMSALIYRDARRQFIDSLEKLWTHYYQAVADAVEQRPSGGVPLVAIRRNGASEPENSVPGAAPPKSTATVDPANPFSGAWIYVSGSHQFNGVGEPVDALLELWLESGQLVGRLRAELPDFQGVRKIDVRLRGPVVGPCDMQTLEFESKEPTGTGKITLEPGISGMDLMLVRPATQTVLPRGREVLRRR